MKTSARISNVRLLPASATHLAAVALMLLHCLLPFGARGAESPASIVGSRVIYSGFSFGGSAETIHAASTYSEKFNGVQDQTGNYSYTKLNATQGRISYLTANNPGGSLQPDTITFTVVTDYSGTWVNADMSESGTFVVALPPTVTTTAATSVTTSGATLNAGINPNNAATTAQFQYGPTMSYGSVATITLSPNNGIGDQNVSLTISGLAANTLYHFRAVATNAVGGDVGGDLTFTTLAAAPVITSASTASGTVGQAFSFQITANNNPTSFTTDGLPPGLAVHPTTGLISGTPTVAGTSNVTLSASNTGGTGSAAWSITVSPSAAPAQTYTFTTLAGLAGNLGSTDGAGSAARFNFPYDVAVDGVGNVYVADSSNRTIRKMTPGGVVTTLAGLAGSGGFTDGTGSAARFGSPNSVAVDGAGNVYVADYNYHTIRKVTPAGVVTTLAGEAGSRGSTDGAGSAARFANPNGVGVDGAGNVYVADLSNNTIRKVTPGGVVTTLAGLAGSSGSTDGAGSAARFFYPNGLALDGAGNVYVADYANNTIRKVTPGGVVTTLAGLAGSAGSTDGTASAARFNNPADVAVDSVGTVYVAGFLDHTIRKVTPGGVVTTLAGLADTTGSADGTGSAARFFYPTGIAVDSPGNVYVADWNHTIRKGVPTGAVSPPVITTQPQSQAAIATSNVTFTVAAIGSGLTYQWRKGAVDIGGATSAMLTLNNVTRASSGTYSVVVTSGGSSTPSSDATLRVIVPQQLLAPQRGGGGQFQLRFTDPDTAVGGDLSRFEVHHTTNFLGASTVWVTNSGSFTLSNGKILFDDTGSTGVARRFYRVIER